MKKLFSVVLSLILVFCLSGAVRAQNKTLRFDEQGKFTILQISDPQDDHHPAYDMLNLIKLAIEQSDPDLVVFSGDIVDDLYNEGDSGIDDEDGREGVCVYDGNGDILFDETFENVRVACGAIFEEVEQRQIPFAVALGNNDYKTGLTADDWLDVFNDYDMNLTTDEGADDDNRIDFRLNILSSASDDTAFALWIMDTGLDEVKRGQIDWFLSESNSLKSENNGEAIPSIVFQHIPVDDIGNLFERCHIWDAGATLKGSRLYRLNKEIAVGHWTSVRKPGITTDEFTAWKESGGVLAAFFGHLHTQGYSGTWQGIELGLTYGSQFAKKAPYGFRVVTLNENDPGGYCSDLYLYEGSVSDGDAEIVKQINEPYPVYNSFKEAFVGFFRNTFDNLKKILSDMF